MTPLEDCNEGEDEDDAAEQEEFWENFIKSDQYKELQRKLQMRREAVDAFHLIIKEKIDLRKILEDLKIQVEPDNPRLVEIFQHDADVQRIIAEGMGLSHETLAEVIRKGGSAKARFQSAMEDHDRIQALERWLETHDSNPVMGELRFNFEDLHERDLAEFLALHMACDSMTTKDRPLSEDFCKPLAQWLLEEITQ
jgi:hypothetical protein